MDTGGIMKTFLLTAILLLGDAIQGTKASDVTQSQLDKIAQAVTISAKVLDNLKNSTVLHSVRIELHNAGTTPVPSTGWKLFFYSTYLLFPSIFPKSKTTILDVEKLKLTMCGGNLFALEPANMFREIGTSETRVIELEASYWSVSETMFMPNWYFVSTNPDVEPRIAKSTESMDLEFVKPFDDVRQWKRYTHDRYNPFTSQERMNRLNVKDTGKVDKPIIPTPLQVTVNEESSTVEIDSSWKIFKVSVEVDKVANYVASELNMAFTSTSGPKTVRLSVEQLQTGNQSYELQVSPNDPSIIIKGNDPAGLFYGIQSLLSLLETYPNGIPETQIRDKPRFEYRGMHVDVSRNFHTVDDIKRLMDAMTMYKMNKLHLHLSDDEGWRLDIPDLPQLTMVGAKRCHDHDLQERHCILPQWGSGPFKNSSGSGFYTGDDYKQLLLYADERFIEVIPEFDMPGHAHAAIRAMEVRYNTTPGAAAAERYRLIDPDDTSFYYSVQYWMDNAINPCIESTYEFIAKIVDTVVELHKGIQPLKTYHFGGDEVAKGAWENSTKCEDFLVANPEYNISKGLKKYFVERVANLTAERGLGLRGWEDGFMDGDDSPFSLDQLDNKDVSANIWDNIWEWGKAQRAYKFANAGYKVVMSQATDLYFDHPYEPDPEERGLYWATRYTDTKKVFGFLPESLYDNIDERISGKPAFKTDVDICGEDQSKCESLVRTENIIGMQGQLRSETVRTSENFDNMIFPRLLALAERAWYKASFEDESISVEERKRREDLEWEKFANTLGHKELKRLAGLGILYRIPPPGARVTNGKVDFSVTFPGLTVQYSIDNGTSWNDVISGADVEWGTQKVMHLRTKSGNRYSRVVELFEVEPIPYADQDIIDYVSTSLEVSAGVVDNLNKDNNSYIVMQLKLKNNGETIIHKATWKLYFTNLYGVKEEDLDCSLTVVHVNGDLYYFTPSPSFTDLEPEGQIHCTWHQRWWNTAKTDFFPNWYVSSEGMVPKVIANTNETLDYVLPHDTPAKWKRTNEDQYNPYKTEGRYEMHQMTDSGSTYRIIPTPVEIIQHTEDADIKLDGWVIVDTSEFQKEVDYLAGKLKLSKVSAATPHSYIQLVKFTHPPTNTSEAYQLDIQSDHITIEAEDKAGAFYGVQTLISLFETGGGVMPSWKIVDRPRFGYRGIMIDTARNFKSKELVFKILDAMAMYKLNTLHIHLSDDEAWRLEIPGFSELTEMGSNRCQNQDRDICLIPQRGSGPDKSPPGSGFYSVDDYQEILRYAVDRHITVIPEIDMPGHSRAAITAMEYRDSVIRKLNSQGSDTSNMKSYLLSDAQTDGDIKSIQNWRGNALNPCMNSTYDFVSKVLDELILMHRDVQDLRTFHIGGDEVAPGSWDDSKTCKSVFNSTDTTFLKRYFVKRVAEIVASKGLDVAAWEDGVYANDAPNPRTDFTSRNVYAYAWNNVWGDGNGKRSAQFADEGYKVILAMATHLYLDFPYEPDPEEMGLYWATRYVSTKKIFGFMPDDIFANADVDKMGKPIDMSTFCQKFSCPKTTNTNNVIGMQGTMFSDLIRTEEEVHYSLFPKLLAVAERSWHKGSWEDTADKTKRDEGRKLDWGIFASKLGHQELPRLEKHNFLYRVPPPGGRIEGDELEVNTLYPNHDVEMSTSNGKIWSLVDTKRYLPHGNYEIQLRTKSKLLKRPSRVVTLTQASRTSGASAVGNYYLAITIPLLLFSMLLSA